MNNSLKYSCIIALGIVAFVPNIFATQEDSYEKQNKAMHLIYGNGGPSKMELKEASELLVDSAMLELKEESNTGESLIFIERHIGKEVDLIQETKNKDLLIDHLFTKLEKKFGLAH